MADNAEMEIVDVREDGPFDIDEVEIDGDGVERLDMGSMILTPSEGMELHLQVDPDTNAVPAILGALGESAVELALFAAPRDEDPTSEVRDEIVAATEEAGGTTVVTEDGPFGPELMRQMPVTGPEGEEGLHVSRTWLIPGPRWMLRAILMGRAAIEPDATLDLPFVEFVKNTVVRRGSEPRPTGEIIPMTLPEGVTPQEA